MNIKVIFILLLLLPISLLGNPFQNSDAPKIRNPGIVNSDLVELQLIFRERISDSIKSIKSGEGGLLILLLSALVYGLLHAAGPGHRKTVLFTIFMSNKSRWWEPITAGWLSATVHGFSAIAIVFIFSQISRRLLSARVGEVSSYMEIGSFILLIILSILFIIKKIIGGTHSHGSSESKKYLATVIATSLFPCPAAVLILILSLSLNLFYIGAIGVIFLSIGMGITISTVALLGRGGRVGLYRTFSGKEKLFSVVSSGLEIIGYIVLILFSLWMLLPFI